MTDQQPGDRAGGRFFDAHQRATIEAAMARIIPTDDHPGAREAGTIDFLDQYLSGIDYIYAKPDGSGFEKLEGKRAEAWMYRVKILQEKYVAGIKELDRRSRDQFDADFARLNPEQQDSVLTALEKSSGHSGEALVEAKATAAFGPVEPALQQTSTEIELDFFPLLALHTRQGFYSDPIYGGNKDRAGWKLIGFEGPASLADSHAGRYTTLPYFAPNQPALNKQGE